MKNIEKYFTPLAIKLMEENEISIKTLVGRIFTGCGLDEAFSYKIRGNKTIYPKWAYESAKKNGISRQLLYHRINIQGLSVEEAVTRRVRPKGFESTE